MIEYKTQNDLALGYAEFRLDVEMAQNNIKGITGLHTKEWIMNKREVLIGVAHQIMKYSPLLYKGGFVVPGFGYSTERIGQYGVTKDNCGAPDAVGAR